MQRLIAASLTALLVALASPAGAQTPAHSSENVVVTNPDDGTTIAITVFKPGTAAPDAQVPVIFHSHGWGGSRSTSIGGEVKALLDAGFGVVSFDQRGHGASSGEAHIQDPTRETEDVKAVIDHVATLDWVLHNRNAAGAPLPDDPVLGAIGGSYGGGYQTMTALDEIADEGRTRFDALAPEITWYDLNESLAPQKVVRTAWDALLYAAGASMLPQYVHEANTWGVATGLWPDGTLYGQPAPGIVPDLDAEFHKHGPIFFAEQGIKIDVPILMRQGTSDNLFNLNQGLDIFHKALTDDARADSYFVAYNGGHALPNALPAGTATGGDSCSTSGEIADWAKLRIEFFRKAFAGATDGLLPARYNFTNLDNSGCLRFDGFDATSLSVDPTGTGALISTVGVGAPLHFEVAEGPLTITGVPTLKGVVSSIGLDNRAFFGLSVGTSPADALVIQNNLMPLRALLPQVDNDFAIELPGVAVEIPQGESLFLTVSPISDMYIGHGTRGAGGLVLSDLTLTLPEPLIARPTTMTLERTGKGARASLVATLTETESGAPVAGVPVAFSSGATSLGSASTNDQGIATVGLKGKYAAKRVPFLATFVGNDRYEPSSASISG